MASLTGRNVRDSYIELLKLNTASTNTGVTGSLLDVTDGGNTASALSISTSQIASTVDGSAGTAAFTRKSDTNTGVFFPAADTISATTNGTERMRIDSSGNVGIGNTSPSSFYSGTRQLVVGSGSGEQGITIYGGNASASFLAFADGTTGDQAYRGIVKYDHAADAMMLQTGAAERLRIDSSGNVIISGNKSLISNGAGGVASNTSIGDSALVSNTTGFSNTASGYQALYSNSTGNNNTASGFHALLSNTTGFSNTASGVQALYSNSTGVQNTASGVNALFSNTTGNNNTASGFQALYSNTTGTNISGFGHNAQVTGSNQVQLGDSATTVYAYGAVQDRSDIRDKADIRNTTLGLEFINALRPVDFKWDMREDYRTESPALVVKPTELKEDASDEDKAKYQNDLSQYNAYLVLRDAWLEEVKLSNITHDGSKKRNRYHHGLIAQEVETLLNDSGIDFGGYQDHSIKGGDDVRSIGYGELIAPLIKAVQELSAKVVALEVA